ncbi:MAG: hypothetical protein OXQ29_02750 [Rhodospirillaceae bacterium]|nr:hypothetical protein [Rhodospirillaceae bacterium]
MSSPVFDTLKAANSLKAAGFDDRQAEAVVTTVGGAMIDNLVTKQDLESALRAALKPMVTREELRLALEPMVTREELRLALEPMVTRAEFRSALKAALEPMVTKEYLERYLKEYLDRRLEPMATRSDLQLIQHQVTTRLGALVVACAGVLGVLIGLF